MFRRIAFFLVFLAFSAALHAAQPKEALLIANGKYSHFAGLAHPSPDAAKLSAALEQLGFRVRVVRDGNREQMLDAISEFERGLRNTGAIAFFHYGGHGVQVDGKNYLLPADADIPDERRVATRAVALDEVMTAMDAAAARASIIVIDACRDNPLPAGSGRNLARGLSVVGMKPKNSIVIYAAEAGSKALDGLFTPILANALQEKDKTIDQVMKKVRKEVYAKSSGQQTPGEYNQLFEELVLGDSAESGSTKLPSWQIEMFDGRRHVSIEDVSRFYKLQPPAKNGKYFEMSSKGFKIRGEADTPEVFINNVKYALCFPIHQKDDKFLISAMDVTKIIEPVMRPGLINKNAAPVRTVILDAGHSKHYSETKGNWALEEKEASLDVVLRAKRLLEQRGYKVYLTRSRDIHIPINERASFANKFTNAVFISVQFNKSSFGGDSGIETFTPLSLTSLMLSKVSGAASGIQTFTLAPRGLPSMGESFSYSDLKLHPGNTRDSENIALATALHSSILKHLHLLDRGINRARLSLICDLKIPAAILDGGCINHPLNGRLIASSQYRDAFALAILEGVERFNKAISSSAFAAKPAPTPFAAPTPDSLPSKTSETNHDTQSTAMAVLSVSKTGVGRQVKLVVTVRNASSAEVPQSLNVSGLSIQFVGRSRKFEMNKEKISSSLIYTYSVLPLKSGDFKIPPFDVIVNEKKLKTKPLQLKVLGS